MNNYPSYKTTSIPWLPSIPIKWNLVKAKFLFDERVQKGYEDEPLLAATQLHGVIPKSLYENTTVTAQKDFHLLKLVEVGDFVISLRSFQGGIEYAYYKGIISPAYTIFYHKDHKQINAQYFKYFFKSQPFVDSLKLFVTGIREGQNIDYSEFKDSLLPLPSYYEQTAIANYLDAQSEKIETFISKKQKLIELLKEQKQSVINELIENKDGNWERIKLKYCIKHISIQTTTKEDDEIYLGMENIESKTGKFVETDQKDFESQAKRFKIGQVLFGKLRPYLAKVFLATFNGVCSGEFLVFEPNKNILPEFLMMKLLSNSFISLVDSSTFGTKMPRAEWSFIGNVIITIPLFEAQQQIVNKIKSESTKIDIAISRIEKEIEFIKEYKRSLIAEVVTGKIKVL